MEYKLQRKGRHSNTTERTHKSDKSNCATNQAESAWTKDYRIGGYDSGGDKFYAGGESSL